VGRFKTKAVKDMILDKNPFAKVITVEKRVEEQTKGLVEDLVAEAEVVICVTDNRDSRVIVNRICVEQRKVCFFSGAYRRAYGGRIQRVRPYESACYQCFLMSLPDEAANEEVSNIRQAQALSYSDRIVPVEPGLANDIAPITQMLSKLVIQELLKDKQTTLRSLDEDLCAPIYLWFNRREIDTEQQKWEPLEFNIDGFRILRWYGAPLPRNPDCPVCGDYLSRLAKQQGLPLPQSDK
jgi:molybdopterin/thiamine biosynthesis adenylyltransferase